MELTYRTEGDFLLPNLTLPEETVFGKYALLRRTYLKKHRRILYLNLLTTGTLDAHLSEIEQAANERIESMVTRMAAEQGVTETLKASDQMEWVGRMNNLRHSAEEVILRELIHT